MLKARVKFLICFTLFASFGACAYDEVFDDVAKVKECWLKCRDDAEVAGNKALEFFEQQESLNQAQVDAYTDLIKFFTRIFLDRGDYITVERMINAYLSRSPVPSKEVDLAAVYVNQGIYLKSTNRIVLAEQSYFEALEIFRRADDKRAQGIVLSNLGTVSFERNRVPQAIEYYQSAIAILEQMDAPQNLATTLNNVGIQLMMSEQYDLAEQYISRARELIKDLPNPRVQVQVIQAYAWNLIYSEQYEHALDYALENDAFIQETDLTALQSHHAFIIGTIRENLSQFAEAEEAFQRSLEIAEQVGARNSVESALLGLGRVASKRGEFAKAMAILDELYDTAIADERYVFAEEVQTQRIAALSNDKQYEAAFDAQSAFLEAYQARVKDDQENELAQFFALLETEEEKRKVIELQRDNAQQALELSVSEQQRQQMLGAFIIVAMVFVFIGIWLAQRRKIARIQAENAQQLLDKKNEMLSEISHELRTPITAIRLQIETLEYELSSQPDRTYALVYDKLSSLNRLIDDVFQLSKADSQELDLRLEPTNVQQFVLELAEAYEPQLSAKQISLAVEDKTQQQAFINIDKRRIEQVFANLISNTLRYTDSPGSCRLTLQQDNNNFCIRFEDSAPGVSEDNLSRLFERLYREEASRNRALGGSGLGLSIVEAFVTAHRGSIKASQSELGGLCFDIVLPIKDA